MATIDAAIAAGADDVALDDNGFDAANGYPVLGRAGTTDCIYAFRVPVSGLQGATITAAWIDNVNQANGGAASPTLAIYAEDAASPARITSLTDLNGRTRTTAKVDWDVAWTGYQTKDSPSIVSIIQELADSYDPTYIQLFIQNDGGAAGVQVYAFEGEYPPTLHIEYTPGSSGISGSASITLGALTVAAPGAVAIAGAASRTLAALALSGAGAVAITGASSPTLGALAVSSAGKVGITGAADNTLAGLTLAATGVIDSTPAISGAADITLASLTVVSAGAVAIDGETNAVLDGLALEGAGNVAIIGNSNITLDGMTAQASGRVAIVGAGSVALDGLTLAAAIFIGVITTPASRTHTPGGTNRVTTPAWVNRVTTPAFRRVDEPEAVDRTGD